MAARFPRPAFDLAHARYDPPLARGMRLYVMLQFALLLGMAMHFLALVPLASLPILLAYAAYLIASLCVVGLLMEGRRWASWLEGVRVAGTALAAVLGGMWFGIGRLDGYGVMAIGVIFGLSALTLPWLQRGQRALASHGDAVPAGVAQR